ncbi:MAG: hypothetical protein M3Q47_07665 [Actinomycetota bacterium]|nr:hypothetical protein [Actinomycetota bacterium]
MLNSLRIAGRILTGSTYAVLGFDAYRASLQRTQFHKNMAMIGGLLFAALD